METNIHPSVLGHHMLGIIQLWYLQKLISSARLGAGVKAARVDRAYQYGPWVWYCGKPPAPHP